MKVTYRLKLGQDEFELNLEVKDEKDFFEQLSFYSNLPKSTPKGSTDLKLVFRTTTEGHKYYSLVSEQDKLEFKFGQNKENQGGGLFPKGWQALYNGEASQNDTPAPAPAQVATPRAAPPKQTPAPAQQYQAPAPTPVQPQQPSQVATPNVSPQVAATASNVLSRFGINK